MTENDFRRIALGMKDAMESSHMDHPDFRVHNRIFATLHPDLKWGMVKLTPEQQERFVADAGDAFVPEKGAWGLQGCTAVRLAVVDEEMLGEAMTLAWRDAREKGPTRRRKAAIQPQARKR
jgi:YjbR